MFDQVASAHKWSTTTVRTHIILMVLSTVSIILRFVAKGRSMAKFGLDDMFIIAATAMCYATGGINIYAAHLGGQTVSMLTEPSYSLFVKWCSIAGMLYPITVLCISLSILFFYRRVFPIQSMKRLVTIFLVIHVMWTIAAFFAQIFICSPVELAWAPIMIQAQNIDKCINYPIFFLSILSIELGLNAAVLFLPIKQVIGLKMNLQTRLMLVFVFLLGGVSLISGIVRIYETYIPGEPYIDLAGDVFWLAIHENTALIAASLPIYRPLINSSMNFLSSKLSKVYGSGYGSKGSEASSNIKESKGYSTIGSEQQSQKSLVDPIDRQYSEFEMQTPKKAHTGIN
ncbi:hypothetical protein B0J11DRAFT_565217 [Dendryphion nanum]|uniref:Rhodopsin domain-containing protein n=1 Tax=Dendryphion nanum TaxID=256645 RepID=A0A9P9IXL2_9PLEO|nr:hypothetical protein B0J11DRAFT_565217 [Dendryphion nanum]